MLFFLLGYHMIFVVFIFLLRCSFKLQVEPETGEYIKDSRGFCVQAGVNEPGEMVGAIRQHVKTSEFDGYTDAKATNKKVC